MAEYEPEPDGRRPSTGYAFVKYGIILIIVIVVLFFVVRYLIPAIQDIGDENDGGIVPTPTGAVTVMVLPVHTAG
jgi:ABC-type sulfate transport system permease subunit